MGKQNTALILHVKFVLFTNIFVHCHNVLLSLLTLWDLWDIGLPNHSLNLSFILSALFQPTLLNSYYVHLGKVWRILPAEDILSPRGVVSNTMI